MASIKRQAFTWTTVNQVVCRHVESLGNWELGWDVMSQKLHSRVVMISKQIENKTRNLLSLKRYYYQNPSYANLVCIQDANVVVNVFVDNLVFFCLQKHCC